MDSSRGSKGSWTPGRYGTEQCPGSETWGYLLDPDGNRCTTGQIYLSSAKSMARLNNKRLDGRSFAEAKMDVDEEDQKAYCLRRGLPLPSAVAKRSRNS